MENYKNILLKQDSRVGGSYEHFYHFMLGYLLPAVHSIIVMENHKESNLNKYLFLSCGPTMDGVIHNIMDFIEYPYEIVMSESALDNESDNLIGITLPRWDSYLQYILEVNAGTPMQWKFFLPSNSVKEKLYVAINIVKSVIADKFDSLPENNELLERYKGKFLVLQRSSPPEYYQKYIGSKTDASYGSSRRSMQGMDEIVELLRTNDLPTEIFEAGKYTLIEQISVIANCKGIIGIRGAEFANLIWMAEGSAVFLVKPASIMSASTQIVLAEVMKMNYKELVLIEGGNSPRIDGQIVCDFLKNH